MIRPLVRGIRRVLRRTPLYDAYIALRAQGLHEVGWFRSLRMRQPVDREGRPLPWYTYAAVQFLATRVTPRLSVFEFGCGNSTLWWAERVSSVCAVEHDASWYAAVHARVPANVSLEHRPMRAGYADSIRVTGRVFDVVVIDGRLRNRSAEAALRHLSPGGVVVWDNAERPQYRRGLRILEENGFRRLDFHGLAAGSDLWSLTAILYRPGNCLGI